MIGLILIRGHLFFLTGINKKEWLIRNINDTTKVNVITKVIDIP